MNPVTKAVIPAAGAGTRMRPFSRVVPKELAPLGHRPALHWVLDEAEGAGLTDIALVVGPDKQLLHTYLDSMRETGLWEGLRLAYVLQDEPLGLGDAISRCRDFCAGEPFAVLLPDNVVLSPAYRGNELLRLFAGEDRDVVGVQCLDSSVAALYGNCGRIEYTPRDEGSILIHRLHDKKPGTLRIPPGESLLRTCGRYVLRPDFFERIERLRPGVRGELDEVPVVQEIARERGLLGGLIASPLFDVGQPRGLLAASAYLHEHPELLPGI